MRDLRYLLKPEYGTSHALVIGVNDYVRLPKLGYAVNDARAVAARLTERFDFDPSNVTVLLDDEATGEGIRRAFARLQDPYRVSIDDRIVVFFAGHGTTRPGLRGEVGFLVPRDGDPDDLSGLIRWDELTRGADLIPAKHVLFLMDACYGGLAITRAAGPGSSRFLHDMLRRFSKQVLTAGKADETVADSGGPLPGHSVFTGHLLQGLDGGAATPDGVITASGLMAYAYSHVARDAGSFQTPHYGHLDGDGDFVFQMPAPAHGDGVSQDPLIVIPYPEQVPDPVDLRGKVAQAKELLGHPERGIQLHDFVIDEVRRLLAATSSDAFSLDAAASSESIVERLAQYEAHTRDLATIEACIAHWAAPVHRPVLRKALARSVDRLEPAGGRSVWLALRWYPLVLQVYSAGIAAVEAGRYDTLSDVFLAPVPGAEGPVMCLSAVAEALSDLNQAEVFKSVPGHERFHTPASEYLFKLLQPQLDDALFLGRTYETAFDEFEVLLSMSFAFEYDRNEGHLWGPLGRFAWKQRHSHKSPLARVIAQAKSEGDAWGPVRQGLIGRTAGEFDAFAARYCELIKSLRWG